jgi:hypothetical protein
MGNFTHRLLAVLFRFIGFAALAIVFLAYCPNTAWSGSRKDHPQRHSFQWRYSDGDILNATINSNGLLAKNKKRNYSRDFENLSP